VSVAVLIPTRGRPEQFMEAVASVRKTSKATVLAYIDEDQKDLYPVQGDLDDTVIFVGPRVGPVASANILVQNNPGYEAYGLITDDSRILTPGWDEYLMACLRDFSRFIVVSPHHYHGSHVDMPFVSKEWISETGWYACPEFHHYCWPIITGLIGEMTAVVHCPEQSFSIDHDYEPDCNIARRISDNAKFFDCVTLTMPSIVERIRGLM